MSETYRLKVNAIRVNHDDNGLYDLRPYGVADRYHNLTLSDVVDIYQEDYYINMNGAEKDLMLLMEICILLRNMKKQMIYISLILKLIQLQKTSH